MLMLPDVYGVQCFGERWFVLSSATDWPRGQTFERIAIEVGFEHRFSSLHTRSDASSARPKMGTARITS
jgi:hypothetical protein